MYYPLLTVIFIVTISLEVMDSVLRSAEAMKGQYTPSLEALETNQIPGYIHIHPYSRSTNTCTVFKFATQKWNGGRGCLERDD
jgi:hypothetical protein